MVETASSAAHCLVAQVWLGMVHLRVAVQCCSLPCRGLRQRHMSTWQLSQMATASWPLDGPIRQRTGQRAQGERVQVWLHADLAQPGQPAVPIPARCIHPKQPILVWLLLTWKHIQPLLVCLLLSWLPRGTKCELHALPLQHLLLLILAPELICGLLSRLLGVCPGVTLLGGSSQLAAICGGVAGVLQIHSWEDVGDSGVRTVVDAGRGGGAQGSESIGQGSKVDGGVVCIRCRGCAPDRGVAAAALQLEI